MAKTKRMRVKKRLVIDIGSSAIRVCELGQSKTGFVLKKYVQRDLAIDPSLDDESKKEIRLNALKEVLKESKIRYKMTIFGVQGQSVFTRNRTLPPVREYKVTPIVRYEIQQQIPFSLDQIALDYQVLSQTEAGGYDVMMAAIKVDVVERQIEIFKEVKRSIETVDVCPLAAYNWLKHSGEFGDEGECVALVDLGATTTDIVIERDNFFRFTRSLNVGGNNITKAISENFGVDFLEAEKLKRERGFAPTGDPKRDGKGGEIIGKVLHRIVTEISRSFAYFRSQTAGGTVNRVIVTGGGACLRNIIPYLQRQLGVEVRIAQPLAGLATEPPAQQANEHPEQAAVVLGLALRCVDTVPIEINLIPPRIIESARRREQTFYWALSFCTLGLIMASIIPISAERDDQVRQRIKVLEGVMAAYDPTLVNNPDAPSEYEEDLDQARKEVSRFNRVLTDLDNARQYRHFWLDEIVVVNDARPRTGVWISAIETTVIGGPGNTGIKARNESDKESQGDEPQEAEAAPAESDNPFASLMGLVNLAGVNKGAATNNKGFNSSGFPGIFSGGASLGGQGNAPGLRAFGSQSKASKKGPQSQPVTEPNGLIVIGYAESIEKIVEYQTNLESTGHFVEGGVYFHERLVDNVPMSSLDSANLSLASANSAGSIGRSSGSRSGSGGGVFTLSALNFQTTSRFSQPAYSDYNEPEIFSFRFDLQFLGNSVPQPQ